MHRWRPSHLLALGIALASCRDVRAPAPPAPALRVVHRVLEERPNASPLMHAGYESLNDVRKPVLRAVSVEPSVVCMPVKQSTSPSRPCTITVPRSLFPVQTLIVETAPIPLLRSNTKSRDVRRRLQHSIDLRRRARFALRRHPLDVIPTARQLPFWMTPGIRAWPVLGVGAWDVLSRPIQIPEGAVLTFAVGVQQPAWYIDSAPVQFTIEARAVDGDVEIYRRSLDPARRLEERRWFDERVSLAAVAGKTVVLHFRVRPLTAGELRPQLPMWADPTVSAPSPTPQPMPSIVLVSLDTLRAKSMSAYGYELETTPFLTRFGATATRFANAYTSYSNTFGSHMSMLTGAYPGRHFVRTMHELSPDIPTLAERLRRAGYDTAAFTEDALLDAGVGFQRGFAGYWENKAVETGAGDAPGTFARALAWLATHRDRPFFLFVHTYAVHAPYRPDPPYDTMFLDSELAHTNGDRLAYEQEVRQLDDDVAALVAALDTALPPERFVLMITADHGEEFWEHGGMSHGQLYDEILHVPLFVRWPGHVREATTLDAQVSLIDVTPTLLDLVGLDPTVDDGLSLAPLLRGTASTLSRSTIFAESPPAIWTRYTWNYVARRNDAKCFSFELPYLDRCFELASDPDELAPQPPDANLPLWEEARIHGEFVASATPVAPPPVPQAHTDPERVEKLRALGYLQ